MAALHTRAVTSAVFARLRSAIGEMPKGNRPNYYAAALVLTHLARWAKTGGLVNEATSQIAAATLVPERMVRLSLDAISAAGITQRLTRGGGRASPGSPRSAALRILVLDFGGDGQLITIDEAKAPQRMVTVQTVRETHSFTDSFSDGPDSQQSLRNGDGETSNCDGEGPELCLARQSPPLVIQEDLPCEPPPEPDHKRLPGESMDAFVKRVNGWDSNRRFGWSAKRISDIDPPSDVDSSGLRRNTR